MTDSPSGRNLSSTQRLAQQIEDDGFAIVPQLLDESAVRDCRELIEDARRRDLQESVSNSTGTYGLRNLTDVEPRIARLMTHPALTELVGSILGPDAFMIRSTLFDKTPGANWGVFWHQDLSIAVRERCEVDGFNSWTRKAGVHSVQPPVDIMRRVLAVRLHLDDCLATNGALKVLPGTHRSGRLPTMSIESEKASDREIVCEVPAGGALALRPLLLHASAPMVEPSSRRVIHFEFANFDLPAPLQWRYCIPCGCD